VTRIEQLEAAVAALGVLVVVVLLLWWRSRRHLVRRIASVISRLEGTDRVDVVGRGRLESSLSALERAAGTGTLRVSDAQVAVDRLADAFRLVGHGIVVCDENGDEVFRNARADELVGDRLHEALADEAVTRLLVDAVEGRPGAEQLELFGPPHRTLQLTASPLVNDARLVGAVAVIEDISERRRLEAVRRDFVANISHELKTPVGALGLLAETLAGEDDPVVAGRLAERMQNEAFRVGRIIEDLLDLSRIESEESPLRDPVPVHLILAEAADRVRSVAEHRGIRLEVHEPVRRLAVLGDRRQLVSAVHSLVENAVTYSDDGAEVVVDTRTNGTWVEITVSDTGIGIPQRDLERIFERFYRVDRARARDTGGTGLGLSIVRHVAGNHGGEVRVQSQEGRGSTFTLRLPAGPGPVALTNPPTAEAG
jgi:two-component system, OmpR family, sensor histidine kinase SenX3